MRRLFIFSFILAFQVLFAQQRQPKRNSYWTEIIDLKLEKGDTLNIKRPSVGFGNYSVKKYGADLAVLLNLNTDVFYLIEVHDDLYGSPLFSIKLCERFISILEETWLTKGHFNLLKCTSFIAKGQSEPFISSAEVQCINNEGARSTVMFLNCRIRIIVY